MSEEKEVHLVAVRIFRGNTARLEAELARGVLADEGIECVIPGEAAADTFPFLDVPLLVREADVKRASDILNDTFVPVADDDQSEEDEEPRGE